MPYFVLYHILRTIWIPNKAKVRAAGVHNLPDNLKLICQSSIAHSRNNATNRIIQMGQHKAKG